MKLPKLQAMPTLHVGHTDDLKIETPTKRIWLSRLTIEDGMPYNNQVTEEKLHAVTGSWVTVKQYEAK